MNTKNDQYTILLVEDNPGDIGLFKEAIQQNGTGKVKVETAMNGEEAIQLLQGSKLPNLIVLDLNLPYKNGFEVLQEIRSSQRLKLIPVIILSSSNDPQDIAKTYELHANCYIQKQSDFNEFLKAMKTLETFWLETVNMPT